MAIAVVAQTVKVPGNSTTVTTDAIDTTGASLLVVATSSYYLGPGLTVTDSKSNTWTALTEYTSNTEARVKMYYCVSPGSVGSGHTFTFSGSSIYGTLAVLALSGAGAIDAGEVGASNASSATLQPGTITPSQSGCICITAVAFNTGSATLTIDSPFSKIASGYADYSGSVNEGLGLAYDIQTTATARNPTWTAAGAVDIAATMAVFRASVTTSTTDGKIIFTAR
jgi:hypothetical protein